MLAMAYPKLLSSADILKMAVNLVEYGDADGLSLRAVASALGVKAPSLYRYFPVLMNSIHPDVEPANVTFAENSLPKIVR